MAIRKAIYNGAVTGHLGDLTVTRSSTTYSDDGTPVAANSPRFGLRCGLSALPTWTEVETVANRNFSWAAGGYLADSTTPACCGFSQGNGQFYIYVDKLPDGSPTHTLNCAREAGLYDLRNADSSEEDTVAYVPRTGLWLPGVIIVYCERRTGSAGGPWTPVGVSMFAVTVTAGAYTIAKIADQTASHSGYNRGEVPGALAGSYFPTSLNQDPVTDVFLAWSDWIATPDKDGGQGAVMRATRLDADSAWTYGGIYVFKDFEPDPADAGDEQFHSAGWTPNGVILIRGDGQAENEIELHTCSDWDDYTTSGNWTEYEGHGSNSSDEINASYASNPGAPCACSYDNNRLFVGSDTMYESVIAIDVPETPSDQGLSLTRIHGYMPAHGAVGNNGWIVFRLQRNAPEKGGPISSIQYPQDVAGDESQARIIASTDDRRFANLAILPTTNNVLSSVCHPWAASHVLQWPRGATADNIHALDIPQIREVQPLRVSPGGTNVLKTTTGDLYNRSDQGTNTITLLATHDAPGFGPVFRCVADGSDNSMFTADANGGATNANGTMIAVIWVKALEHGVSPNLWVNGLKPVNNPGITAKNQWTPFVYHYDTSGLANPFAPVLDVRIDKGESPDFLGSMEIQIEGLYANTALTPFPMAINSVETDEQISQALPELLNADYSIGLVLHAGPFSMDYTAADVDSDIILATIWGDASNYIEINADLTNGEIDFALFNDAGEDGNSPKTIALRGNWQRSDQLHLGVSCDGTNTICYVSNGADENGHPAVATEPFVFDTKPTAIRFGSNDYSEINALEVGLVAVDDETAYTTAAAFEALLGDEAESGPFYMKVPPHIVKVYSAKTTGNATLNIPNIEVVAGQSLILLMMCRDTAAHADMVWDTITWGPGTFDDAGTVASEELYDPGGGVQTIFTGIAYVAAPTAGTDTLRSVFTGGANHLLGYVLVVEGLDTADPLDIAGTANSGGLAKVVTDTLACAGNNIVFHCSQANNVAISSGQGTDFTLSKGSVIWDENNETRNLTVAAGTYYNVQNAAESVTMSTNYTHATSDRAVCAMASFNGLAFDPDLRKRGRNPGRR
jgi:hypothetical protein